MPDYSDEEIDKVSDDVSESEEVSEAQKLQRLKPFASDTEYNVSALLVVGF